jgi:hypothetical protein
MNKNIIFELGGCGINFIDEISSINNNNKLVVISNLEKIYISISIDKIKLDNDVIGNNINISKSCKEIYIINGLGGSSSEYLISIIEELIKNYIKVNVICNSPFSWKGEKRNNLSKSILEKLKTFDITLKVFNNDKLKEYIEDDEPIEKAFKIQSDIMYQYILNKDLKNA